jgi:hypothetical protein
MQEQPTFGLRPRLGWAVAFAFILVILAGSFFARGDSPPAPAAPSPRPTEATSEEVHHFCGTACHPYPPPETFPRSAWRGQIKQAYGFFQSSKLQMDFPSLESVALYYERRAPAQLSPIRETAAQNPPGVSFDRSDYHTAEQGSTPAVTNVNLGHLFDKKKLDIVVCDARRNEVLALKPYTQPPEWQLLGKAPAPCHAEVVDLDGDGIPDVLVACLGRFAGTDERVGSVVWLRGSRDGKFTPYTLVSDLGRVADVQTADFRGVGKLDLVVADFGWHDTGEILYLKNETRDWSQPRFVPRVLDPRTGAIHVAVGDLNNDGRPDIVALISQEHETIDAFLNDGKGGFSKQTVYAAPHPAYGSSGIQLVDMNGDGKLDVLYTNGDILDPPYLLKPYHSIQWLENRGEFPFRHHHVASMYGVMRAVAADLRGVGRKDVVAVSFLPPEMFPQRKKLDLESVVLLEQTEKGDFDRHPLERVTCDHFTCALGDLEGRGKLDLVTGSFCWSADYHTDAAVTIWKNVTARRGK